MLHSGTTTIHRPHGAGTLVIRHPSHPKHPSTANRTHPAYLIANRPATITTTAVHLPDLAENTVSDLETASSISTGKQQNQ